MKIAIATKNNHKIKELSRLINIDGLEFISLADLGFDGEIIEDGSTFAENALIRAMSKGHGDRMYIKGAIKDDLAKFIHKQTKRKPMILPVIMDL